MAHQRQLIRAAVVTALTNATAAGARVLATRSAPWGRTELPGIAVYTSSESVDPESINTAPRELTRTVELIIEATSEATADVDDALDALSVSVERAMNRDVTLGGVCGDMVLSSSDLEVYGEGKTLIGLLRLTYDVTYRTNVPEVEDTAFDDFTTADTLFNLGGAQEVGNQAEDLVTLPTE